MRTRKETPCKVSLTDGVIVTMDERDFNKLVRKNVEVFHVKEGEVYLGNTLLKELFFPNRKPEEQVLHFGNNHLDIRRSRLFVGVRHGKPRKRLEHKVDPTWAEEIKAKYAEFERFLEAFPQAPQVLNASLQLEQLEEELPAPPTRGER